MREFAKRLPGILFALAISATGVRAQTAAPPAPIHVKVVVITMFERGEDAGDTPGEFQLWVEREHLDQIFDVPAAYHHVRMKSGLG